MKKLLIIGTLVLGAVTFAASGTGKLAGNAQPNGVTRMTANNGICVVTGTTERANKGEFVGSGKGGQNQTLNTQGRGRGNGQGRMFKNQVNNTSVNNVTSPQGTKNN